MLPICLTLAFALQGAPAFAQLAPRPGEQRQALPDFEEPEPPLELLPPLPAPEPEGLRGVPLLYVRELRLEGNTVFGDEQLLPLLEGFTGREIASEELVAIRNVITRYYNERGYVNSGAIFPDQDPGDGVVVLRIIEGSLTEVEFQGNEYYRDVALRWLVSESLGTPLNERELEARLQRLLQDRRIEKVRARLLPGDALGEGRLVVELEERMPFRGFAAFSNYATVGVGAERGRFQLAHENLTGMGDVLRARYDVAEGLHRVRGRYDLPFTPWGTSLRMEAEYSDSKIVDGEGVIDTLDIEGEYQGYEAGLVQRLYATPHWTVEAGLQAGWRESKIRIFGNQHFDPREELTVVRFLLEAVYRGRQNVVAARSLLSQGLAQRGGPAVPSGSVPSRLLGPGNTSLAWLAQLQWVSRFGPYGIEAVTRLDLQLTGDPLLAIEQLAFGGHDTVRGYRENEAIRDQGVIASLELRLPVWRSADGDSVLQIAPFVDVAQGWNHRDSALETRRTTIVGTGVGARLKLTRYASAQLYWGHSVDDTRNNGNLQDTGVQFRIAVGFF